MSKSKENSATPNSGASIPVDALIVGGGIAGLWTLDLLRRRGKNVVLVEAFALGQGQTVSAQGIIHGGLKYALNGIVGTDAQRIAAMPSRWRGACEAGGEPALGQQALLSEATWLWASPSWQGRLGLKGARIGLQSHPEPVAAADRPFPLNQIKGPCFRVPEPVVDPRVVLSQLLEANREAIVKIDEVDGLQLASQGGIVAEATLGQQEHAVTIAPKTLILTAGVGNEGLRARLGLSERETQRRPLHMVIAQGPLPALYGHCVEGTATRITISSSRPDSVGNRVWQLGGNLAETGVELESDALIDLARDELAALLPSLPLDDVSISTYRVDRAEQTTPHGKRPEDASLDVAGDGRTLTCWPTKMALAPRLAEAIDEHVAAVHPPEAVLAALAHFDRPVVAPAPWETT